MPIISKSATNPRRTGQENTFTRLESGRYGLGLDQYRLVRPAHCSCNVRLGSNHYPFYNCLTTNLKV